MALQESTARNSSVDSPAERRFKRKLWTGPARHSDRAIEVKLNKLSQDIMSELVDYHGMKWLTKHVGCGEQTLWKLLAGYGERCRPETQQKLKRFLAGYAK